MSLHQFPRRPPAETGVLLGQSTGRAKCPKCEQPMLVFVAHWAAHRVLQHNWICMTCVCAYARRVDSPKQSSVASIAGGAVVKSLADASKSPAEWRYEAWVSGDGMVRVAPGQRQLNNLDDALAITAEQAQKISDDFRELAHEAQKQQERLRGDDRWRVRLCPDRPGVYLVRHHIYAGQYRESPFVATLIKKPRWCEACRTTTEPGATMYREEKHEKWANPNWGEVRICSACVARVDRGTPEDMLFETPRR